MRPADNSGELKIDKIRRRICEGTYLKPQIYEFIAEKILQEFIEKKKIQ